jgi:methylmalonyl-CoA mutase
MKNNKFLFEEFPPVTEKEWKQKIQFDLKGEDYSTLITKTLEGIDIKPFYHKDSFVRLPYTFRPETFKILHQYDFIPRPDDIAFSFKQAVDKVRITAFERPDEDLLEEKKNDWDIRFYDENFFEQLKEKQTAFIFNPVARLLRTGNWYQNERNDFYALEKLSNNPQWHIEIDASVTQNAGANIVQQLAYALAEGNLYVEHFGKEILPKIRFKFAVGYHYFFETAKFKAFRYLWKIISEHENEPVIYALPSLRNKTLFDPYVNMLRTGMEMMAAVLGGADEIANLPYNYIYKKFDPNAMRLASNQLVLLKEEAKFNRMLNTPEGSYYLEEIAYRLAEKALDVFKQIENGGGLLKQLYEGQIQRKIEENAAKEQQLFDEGKLILTGTNKYINTGEKLPGYDKNPFMPRADGAMTLIKKIIPVRLAEKTERERIKNLKKH